jgi:hypothetical protein
MGLIHSGPQQQDFPVGSGKWAGHSAHTNSFVNLRLSSATLFASSVIGIWNDPIHGGSTEITFPDIKFEEYIQTLQNGTSHKQTNKQTKQSKAGNSDDDGRQIMHQEVTPPIILPCDGRMPKKEKTCQEIQYRLTD